MDARMIDAINELNFLKYQEAIMLETPSSPYQVARLKGIREQIANVKVLL